MNKNQLLENLEKLGMRPGRGLGQNFLLDDNLLKSIVADAKITPGEIVLEVGPGFGSLTAKLLAAGAEVYAVEFDRRLAQFLRESVTDAKFHLTEGDACKVDYRKILPEGKPFRAIANLPYAISTVFVARMLEREILAQDMIFMLQKEMAERLTASPGCKDYGSLTVRVGLYYSVSILRNVPPDVFYPPPEVDSAVVAFALKEERPDAETFRRISGVVKSLFLQRRKQIGKVLSGNFGKEKALGALARCNIPAETRPDKIDIGQFQRLTAELYRDN